MKTEKIQLSGVARRMWGYNTLTPSNVGKLLEGYKLSLSRSRRMIFDKQNGIFATVNIRPELYLLVGKDIQAMHGRSGFVYHAWMQFYADGVWLTDWDKEYFMLYEPFAAEANLLPARVAALKVVRPWWSMKDKTVNYPLFEKDGVKISREFLVKGQRLQACRDEAFCWKNETGCLWHYFEPMHFVYQEIPSKAELLKLSENV